MPEGGLEQGLKGLGDTKGDMFVARRPSWRLLLSGGKEQSPKPAVRIHRMSERPAWGQTTFARQQLAMNPQTWTALQEHGVDGSTELRLDFSFSPPDRRRLRRYGPALRAG